MAAAVRKKNLDLNLFFHPPPPPFKLKSQVMRRYHIQARDDYQAYNRMVGLVTRMVSLLRRLPPTDETRIELTDALLERLYSAGIVPTKASLASAERLSTASLARRRLASRVSGTDSSSFLFLVHVVAVCRRHGDWMRGWSVHFFSSFFDSERARRKRESRFFVRGRREAKENNFKNLSFFSLSLFFSLSPRAESNARPGGSASSRAGRRCCPRSDGRDALSLKRRRVGPRSALRAAPRRRA